MRTKKSLCPTGHRAMNDREDIAAHIAACMRDLELLCAELALLEAGSPDPSA